MLFNEMFRLFVSIIFFILSGVFIYSIEVISFYSPSDLDYWKLPAMLMLCLPALILLTIGHAFLKFADWKRHTGLVLISTTLFAVFIGVTLLCMSLSTQFGEGIGQDPMPRFTDYAFGVPLVIILLSAGLFLLLIDRTPVE